LIVDSHDSSKHFFSIVSNCFISTLSFGKLNKATTLELSSVLVVQPSNLRDFSAVLEKITNRVISDIKGHIAQEHCAATFRFG
jgi:hypothetical protein